MPRKIELTWQSGSRGRNGRWRKKYKGRVLYFAYGTSKSDLEGYRQAMEEWKQRKTEIDQEEALRPKPHQEVYERALEEWTLVLEWSRENGDQEHATAALQKLEGLKARLAKANPPPLAWGDRFLILASRRTSWSPSRRRYTKPCPGLARLPISARQMLLFRPKR